MKEKTHLIQEVLVRGPVGVVEVSQDAVVPAGVTEGRGGQRLGGALSPLGRVGRAVGGVLGG